MSPSVLQVSSLPLEGCLVSLMFQEKGDHIDILGLGVLDASHSVHVPKENWHQERMCW